MSDEQDLQHTTGEAAAVGTGGGPVDSADASRARDASASAAAAPSAAGESDTPYDSGFGRDGTGAVAPLAGGRIRWSLAAALACVIVGALGSVLGSRAVAHNEAAKRRLVFRAWSSEVASKLRLAIQREEDLAASATAFFAANPQASQAQLEGWVKQAQVLRGVRPLQRLSLVAYVRASELAAFGTHVLGRSSEPQEVTSPARATAALKITPSGQRAFYCLAVAGLARSDPRYPVAGVDYCAVSHALLVLRDSGATTFASVLEGTTPALAVDVPVYRGTPATVSARRQAFVGWFRELLEPDVVLREALPGSVQGALRIRHRTGSSSVVFSLGVASRGAQTAALDLGGGWSARTFGPRVDAGVFAYPSATWVLAGGCALSLLFGVLALGGGLGGARRPRPARPARVGRRRGAIPEETLYDQLTGLPNRALVMELAKRMVARASRQSGLLCGALLINIDWFKDINDKLGQAAGDQLLTAVARRLDGVVRASDTVGRLREDEFVVLVESAARGARLDMLARRIVEALNKPVELDDFRPQFHMTASIGVAFGQYLDHQDVLRDAHTAMYAAKAAGKNRYTMFNANMRSTIEGRGLLEAEMNQALLEKQFFAVYQPIRDLRTGRVAGLDAFVRWRHPSRGVLAPADFIGLAEESGLIVPMGRWLLEEVCTQGASWQVCGQPVDMFVRVSAAQLNRDGFVTDVRRALQQSGLEPSSLVLEIAETTVMGDVAAATARLQAIKSTGVRILIDEFDSAYAQRSDLQQMPLDFLKVDRSTLAAFDSEEYRNWLLQAILAFGRDLTLPVIAKGVETLEQMHELRAIGCAFVQGFFVGEPVVAELVGGVFHAALAPDPEYAHALEAPQPAADPAAGDAASGQLG
jgi:diguanylate cyclase (GGDEF)-like protein